MLVLLHCQVINVVFRSVAPLHDSTGFLYLTLAHKPTRRFGGTHSRYQDQRCWYSSCRQDPLPRHSTFAQYIRDKIRNYEAHTPNRSYSRQQHATLLSRRKLRQQRTTYCVLRTNRHSDEKPYDEERRLVIDPQLDDASHEKQKKVVRKNLLSAEPIREPPDNCAAEEDARQDRAGH